MFVTLCGQLRYTVTLKWACRSQQPLIHKTGRRIDSDCVFLEDILSTDSLAVSRLSPLDCRLTTRGIILLLSGSASRANHDSAPPYIELIERQTKRLIMSLQNITYPQALQTILSPVTMVGLTCAGLPNTWGIGTCPEPRRSRVTSHPLLTVISPISSKEFLSSLFQ